MAFNPDLFYERLKIVSGQNQKNIIAEEIGISPSTLTEWTGKKYSSQPSAEQLVSIATRYNCSIDYLLGIENTDHFWDSLSPSDVCRIINSLNQQYELMSVEEHPNSPQNGGGLFFPSKRWGYANDEEIAYINSFIRKYYSRCREIYDSNTLDEITKELIRQEDIKIAVNNASISS